MQQPCGHVLVVPAHYVMLNCATFNYQPFPTLLPTPEAPAVGGRGGKSLAQRSTTQTEPTTICFRNIPNNYSGKMVLELLDRNGCKDTYNFIYVPHDFKRLPTLVNVGYFFVNFVTHDSAIHAWSVFDGFCNWALGSSKVLVASWATKTQGYRACVQRFQDSSVMCQDVPLECRPMFFGNGEAGNERKISGDVLAVDGRIESEVRGHRFSMVPREPTTLCFRNFPSNRNGKAVQELLDENGFKESYNFVYVPHDFKVLPSLSNVGYFFVNFTTHDIAVQAWDKLDGLQAWRPESNKVLRATWATKTQGLEACINRYKDSPVLHQDIPFECKPMRFENGQAVQLDHSVKMQSPQISDGCHRGQSTDYLDKVHVCAEGTIGESDGSEEADADSVPFRSSSALSTSFCSTCTEDCVEMPSSMIRVPNEAGSPDTVDCVVQTVCVPDEAADICSRCETQFTHFRRRHHCRACGRACCAECAPRMGKDFFNLILKRVCVDCAHASDSPQVQASGGDTVIVKNTFLNSKRNASAEELANRIYDDTSFSV
jgi:hypothetical protein